MPPEISPDRTCFCYYCQTRRTYGTTVPLTGRLRSADPDPEPMRLDGYRICETCFARTIPCHDCRILTLDTQNYNFEGHGYCQSCFSSHAYRCIDCSNQFPVEGAGEYALERNVCPDCQNELHTTCSQCARHMYLDNGCYPEGDSDIYCQTCMSRYRKRPVLSQTFVKNRHARTVGYEIEFYADPDSLEEIENDLNLFGNFHEDGSIRPPNGNRGREFASYPTNGDRLFETIRKVTSVLNHEDAGINATCGLHVHLHVETMKEAQRRNIQNWWCVFEPIFFSIVSPSRRNNEYSRSVSSVINRYEENDEEDRDYDDEENAPWSRCRYSAMNISALDEHGTYEIRLHQGTLNGEKIIKWVSLLLEFFETFGNLDMTVARRREVDRMSPRELMIFFFKQMSLSMDIKKYVMTRYREFNSRTHGNAPYILLDKRST